MTNQGSLTSAQVEGQMSKTSSEATESVEGQAAAAVSLPERNVRGSSYMHLLPPALQPCTVLQLPNFEVENYQINEMLTQRVRNMLMTRENRINEEIERQRLADGMSNMNLQHDDDDSYLLDLKASMIDPRPVGRCSPAPDESEVVSGSNMLESWLLETADPQYDESKKMMEEMKKGRCSDSGKVPRTRNKPVAVPYLKSKKTNPKMVTFDLPTPSTSDVTGEEQENPLPDQSTEMNIADRFVVKIKDET